MNVDDTIVAIATPTGRGGIGVVRVAGAKALEITLPMLRLRHDLAPGRVIFAELIDAAGTGEARGAGEPCGAGTLARVTTAEVGSAGGGRSEASATSDALSARRAGVSAPLERRIDEVVVTFFAKPHSYTTDDIIEISAHGSPVVLRHIVELCVAAGARLAEPGEFTMRAFLNGRIDLAQAEAVRDLIESQTLFQAKVAAQQLDGALSRRLQPLKQKVVEFIATLEAGIDFAEDDVSVMPDAAILDRIAAIRAPLEELNQSFAYGKIVHEGLTLAIVGRPNVGKSSLFNRLVERERAIVTATPGTTRDLVSETVTIGGIPIELVDTAGIRQAIDEAEAIGIQKSREAVADADLVLVVLDGSELPTAEDAILLGMIPQSRAILVLNKSDISPFGNFPLDEGGSQKIGLPFSSGTDRGEEHVAEGRLNPLPRVRTSALTGDGIANLRAAILRKIGGEGGAQLESGFLTNVRHHGLVRDSLEALTAATNAVAGKIPHEMLLLDLYNVLRPLDAITGATTTDDILNLIFSTFCIGK